MCLQCVGVGFSHTTADFWEPGGATSLTRYTEDKMSSSCYYATRTDDNIGENTDSIL